MRRKSKRRIEEYPLAARYDNLRRAVKYYDTQVEACCKLPIRQQLRKRGWLQRREIILLQRIKKLKEDEHQAMLKFLGISMPKQLLLPFPD